VVGKVSVTTIQTNVLVTNCSKKTPLQANDVTRVNFVQTIDVNDYDVIIVGQGIAGTWLSYYLLQQQQRVLVIDDAQANAASRVASGVINPVTGRQVVTTWLADTLLPHVHHAYTALGDLLNIPILNDKGIVAFPPSLQMKTAYEQKFTAEPNYVTAVSIPDTYASWFHFQYGAVQIQPAFLLHLPAMLTGWRTYLDSQNALLPAAFHENDLLLTANGIQYQTYKAKYLIYANGVATGNSKYWQSLPFSYNKGEALIVSIPALTQERIFKFGITTLVPWRDGLWWVGSTYDNRFTDVLPTEHFRASMEAALRQILQLPFTVVDHIAAIRPATVERRPFVGLHPAIPHIGIFNGMGTKGCSLAPYFGEQLAQHLINGTPLLPQVDVQRFRKTLER
jgi:hypothetical protein